VRWSQRCRPAMPSPAESYVAGLAPGSRRAQAQALVRIARLLGRDDPRAVAWWKLTPELIDTLRAQLADQGAPATVNRVLSALRGTLRAAWRAGMMDAASYHAARDVRGARGSWLPRGRAIGPEELRRLFREIGHERPPMRERDTALVALAYAGGFRRAELVALDVTDYHRDSGRLRVIGKGNKERAVFLANGARDALHAWLRVRGREPARYCCPSTVTGACGPDGSPSKRCTTGCIASRSARASRLSRRMTAADRWRVTCSTRAWTWRRCRRCSGTRARRRRRAMIAVASVPCGRRRSACRCPTPASDESA
jgi:integrase